MTLRCGRGSGNLLAPDRGRQRMMRRQYLRDPRLFPCFIAHSWHSGCWTEQDRHNTKDFFGNSLLLQFLIFGCDFVRFRKMVLAVQQVRRRTILLAFLVSREHRNFVTK